MFDVRTDDARLTLANVQDAVAAGAVFCSYTAVVGCDDQGVTLRGEQVEASVRCPVFVNAAGSAADDVRRVLGVEGRALVRVCHGRRAVLPPRAGELALCAFLPDGRAHYLIPFEGGTLCGAADVGERAGRAAGPLPAADLAYLLEPGADLGAAPAVRSRAAATAAAPQTRRASRGSVRRLVSQVLSSSTEQGRRLIDVSFSALSPGGTEVPRRTLVAAVQPEGSADVVMLVGSSTANAWKKAEPNMRAMAGSFRIAKLRKTSIARKSKNDYRFEDQGGLNEKATDNVMNLADL